MRRPGEGGDRILCRRTSRGGGGAVCPGVRVSGDILSHIPGSTVEIESS